MNLLYEVPKSKEYNAMRVAAGLSSKDVSIAETALSNSVFPVFIRGEHWQMCQRLNCSRHNFKLVYPDYYGMSRQS